MKILIVLIALIAIVSCADYLVNDQRMIDRINSDPTSSWKAGKNAIFEGKTLSQVKHMLGAFLVQPKSDIRTRIVVAKGFAPKHFDSREQWPTCVHDIRNQGQCGSCWAFAGSEVMSDRFCIATKGATNKVLSPQDMVSCDKGDYGCQGGYLDKEWEYLENEGIVTEACFPYVSQSGSVPPCPFNVAKKCVAPSKEEFKKYYAKDIDHFDDIESAENDIMQHGPILVGFQVYQDFFSYKSGVYTHKSGSLAGGHAVKIVGWGVDSASGMDYWAVANSWGETWGMKGYFWIRKGHNECQMETMMWTGHANTDK